MARKVLKRGYDFERPEGKRFSRIEPLYVTPQDRENERIAAEALRVTKGWDEYHQTASDVDDLDLVFSHKGYPVAYGEVKRRNNKFHKYPDTAINLKKIRKLQRLAGPRPAYLIVYFDDYIVYCDVSQIDETKCIVRPMTRTDKGATERDLMMFIPNMVFLPIKDLTGES